MENALEVNDVKIIYRMLKKFSIKRLLLAFKDNNIQEKEALKGVTFSVQKGEVVGIVGKNGCGKSTLLKTIAGIISPDGGNVDLKGNTISLLALGAGFNEELTGYENIFLSGMLMGLSKENINSKLEEIIEFSELGEDIEKPVRTYSSGMRLKLAFSINTILETDIILIDEALSVGDIRFKEKSYQKIKQLILDGNKTVLIVSHDITILSDLCDRIIWLQDGVLVEDGETEDIIKKYRKYMSESKKGN